MKKAILFAVIGAAIIFAWDFISFAMPNLHKSAGEYTASQDELLGAIEQSGLEEGMYYLGQPDPELSKDEYKSAMEKYTGKPWAVINYQDEYDASMAMNMVRALIIDLIIALMFFWFIRQQKDGTLMKRVLLGVSVGLIGFFFYPYMEFIWYKEPDIWAYLLDGIVPWAILGAIGHKMA